MMSKKSLLCCVLCAVLLFSACTGPKQEPETAAVELPKDAPLDPASHPVFLDDQDALDAAYAAIADKLPMGEHSNLYIDENNSVQYNNHHDGDEAFDTKPSEKQAVEAAVEKLEELGLAPTGEYRTKVSFVERYTVIGLDGGDFADPETVEYTVIFYRMFNGADMVSDSEDGIIISFDVYGITELRYKWRNIQVTEDAPFIAVDFATQEQAKGIYLSLANDPPADPVIKAAYLQRGDVVTPIWVCSPDGHYGKHILLDMNTGEQIVL